MTNIYISSFRDYIKLFANKIAKINAEKETNRDFFSEIRADELNAELDKQADKELKTTKKILRKC